MTRSARADSRPLEVRDLGTVDYRETWDLQHRLAGRRADQEIGDTLLLLEHPSTFTAGRRTEPADLPSDGSPVVEVDRGGKITWHGPGQLVGYPIVQLASPIDVVDYVRRIEQALIEVCRGYGLEAGRVEGRSGVWLPAGGGRPERKVAAIGIRVTRGVTMHGFSLNCDNSFAGFDAIIPCGLRDVGVASISEESGREVTVADVRDAVIDAVQRSLDGDLPVTEADIRTAPPTIPSGIFTPVAP
ncbi:lipoyl(octanoyl) transferase LipB [Tsukamurella sp. 8F]|uniref:lipoyl(octanoyl) transferase LipB n=1 Tax=unclassified Tsukamurella TaxID=2633480 RepID=UPI0023B8FA25|nr:MULTISPECIES: lipoyl(octanoyl) transferase LipB [unclassified Tsukamurella]MDF0529926.1 lipoyl(octanoyl) transferase LipB [Tsukamurella sp. 8J]MDF0587302.1 lipoyl(octanoyl) transferase LipB [Tsukamurella sp. 8F]